MKNLKFIVLILLTAGFWWNIFNVKDILIEWRNAPTYFKKNISSFFSSENLMKVEEARWYAFGEKNEELISKIYYNKAYVLADNFFSFLSYSTPRPYFQSGDGTKFSPRGVEPVAGLLFPFWIFGLISLIKEKKLKPILWTLGITFFAFLLGQRNFAFLLPVLIIYVYIASKSLNKKYLAGILIYLIFIIGRVLWLKS